MIFRQIFNIEIYRFSSIFKEIINEQIHIHIHTHTYIHAHTHTHTHKQTNKNTHPKEPRIQIVQFIQNKT